MKARFVPRVPSADVGVVFFDCPFCKKERSKVSYSWVVAGCYFMTCPICYHQVLITNRRVCDACNKKIDCLCDDTKQIFV